MDLDVGVGVAVMASIQVRLSLFVAMLLAVSACNSGETGKRSRDHAPIAAGSAQSALMGRQVDSAGLRLDELPAGMRVWSSEQSFRAFWSKYGATPAPRIDFRKERVVGIFLGYKPNPGYSVHIERVRVDGDTLVVEYRLGLPEPEMDYPAMIVFPHQLLVVKSSARKARFQALN